MASTVNLKCYNSKTAATWIHNHGVNLRQNSSHSCAPISKCGKQGGQNAYLLWPVSKNCIEYLEQCLAQ